MKKKLTKKAKSKLQPNKIKIEKKRERLKKTLKRVEKKILYPTPDYKKEMKPKKVKTTKLSENPLFIRFLNWEGDKYTVERFLDNIKDTFEYDLDKRIVELKKFKLNDEYLNNLSSFQNSFKKNVGETIQSQNITEFFLQWLNNSFNYIHEEVEEYVNDVSRKVSIVDPEGKWFEAIICYNFIMTFNYFGVEILKNCPVCKSFFCHKGPYAKYCSEGCKERGSK